MSNASKNSLKSKKPLPSESKILKMCLLNLYPSPKNENSNLTIISVNVRDRVCLVESVCSPNRLRYRNMNGTMLSQIVRGMFLAHQVYQK